VRLGAREFVACATLGTALVLGARLVVRSHEVLGARWSDGTSEYSPSAEGVVRHAVWEPAEALAALGSGRGATLSPDGRWLVFAQGERGLNAELWRAEVQGSGFGAPEPLAELNSPADELAPCFGADALWFASDRAGGQGGLDLLRVPYAEGTFGRVERLAPGLNSPADESDPACEPGGPAVVFASNRARRARADFDLYRATPDGAGFLAVDALDALNSERDERDPAFGRDARSLWFASDRAASFDLWRAWGGVAGWERLEPLRALNGPEDERGPWLAAGGFELLFERGAPGAEPVFQRAHSRELLTLPPPPVSLAEWITLALLTLIGVLALLARRWHELDILWKCLLVSLVVHLLLLYGLRHVYPEHGAHELGPRAGPTIRVRLAPDEGPARPVLEARLGPAAPAALARPTLAPSAPAPAAPERLALSAPEAGEAAAPQREELAQNVQPSTVPVELADREERAAPAATEAPELALAAAAASAAQSEPAAPERAALASAALSAPAPASAEFAEVSASAADARSAPARAAAEPEPSSGPPAPALAGPRENFAPASGAAPALALAAERAGDTPAPEAPTRAAAPATGEGSAPAVPRAQTLAAREAASDAAAPGRAALAAGPAESSPPTALRAPAAAPAPPAAEARPFDALAGLATTAGSPPAPVDSAAAPRREALAASAAPGQMAPSTAALAPPAAGPAAEGFAPPRAALAADGVARAAVPPQAELRAPAAEARAARAAAPAPGFDALAGLAPREVPRSSAAPGAPERATLADLSERSPGVPAPTPTQALRVPEPVRAALPERAPVQSADTPYQNRFGAARLRALEEFGGSDETEHAVAAGLAYLARIQNQDGSWGQRRDRHEKYLDVRVGKSALALLAFLGAGHVPGGGTEHAALVERTLVYLLATQDRTSGHFGQSCAYGHGITTYALAECFALTQDARLRAPLERAVAHIVASQHAERDPRFFGGWGYYFGDGHVWNRDEWPRTSVTAWQIMALESARLGGLAVDDAVFDAARTFLANTWDAEQRAFRYSHDPERLSSGWPILPASTPASLFGLSLLGVDLASDELAPARRFVLTRAPDGYRFTGDDDFVRRARGNPYFWYYGSLAMFRVGGREWETWNRALQTTLLPAQDEDGSWHPLDPYAEYAGDDDGERTYTTAMCVLSLEVYYRYFTPLLRVK